MTCLCGCGRETGGEFAPGHDARYKSQLLTRYIEGKDSEALAILKKRKWTKFIEPSRRQRKIKAERAIRMKRREHRQILEEDPSVITDRVRVMKCACEVLKHSDQYHRRSPNHITIASWVDAMVIVAGEHERVLVDSSELWSVLPHMDAVARFLFDPEVERLGLDFEPLRQHFDLASVS